MITWTHSAKGRLDDYLTRIQAPLRASGADPAEVTEDMRRHIDEELAAGNVQVVTIEDVDRILQRLGSPEPMPEAGETPPNSAPPLDAPAVKSKRPRHVLLLLFGVVLPAVTLGIELATRICASTFLDPIPDLWHSLLVAAVPMVNLLSWFAVRGTKREWHPWLGVANGFVLVIALYYAVMYLPLVPYALVVIVVYGLGLLPLAPLMSFAVACRWRVLLGRDSLPSPDKQSLPGLGMGLGLGLVALVLVVLPTWLTRSWSHHAVEDTSADRTSAIRLLRRFGSERALLRDCYGDTGWARNSPMMFPLTANPIATEEARNLYYLVTGRPFNTVPPPSYVLQARSWAWAQDFEWDAVQGGTIVGGRFKHLSLAQSRLDGLVDADAGWSYLEWTLEFKNTGKSQREARAQVALPPGGVVSRLTLWVNGEEREAAFAGRSQVREAYNQVVNVQRRDPVLVTRCGHDRVLLQCFPVPADGGTIKVRMGITAPMQLESSDSALLRWPYFIERNFGVRDDIEHSVWVQSARPLQSAAGALKPDSTKAETHALRGILRDADLLEPNSLVRVRRDAGVAESWVIDPHSEGSQVVLQHVRPESAAPPPRLIVVVDGAVDEQNYFRDVAAAIEGLPAGIEFALLLAKDGVEEISGAVRKADASILREAAGRLRRAAAAGGQDNIPALLRAWELAGERPGSAVLWVHGPQPLWLENNESMKQRLFWTSVGAQGARPTLYELQTRPGPNRIAEHSELPAAFRPLQRTGTVGEDLLGFVSRLRGECKSWTALRERIPLQDAQPESVRGKKSSKHLARLWAYDEIERLVAAGKRDEAVRLAGIYQLVTSVSGAVVLETREQFQRAGLEPVKADSVPLVPEPGTLALAALGLGVGLLARLGRKRRRIT